MNFEQFCKSQIGIFSTVILFHMEHTARSRLQTHLHNGEYCASLGEGASCSENAGGSAWFSWKLSFCARLKLFLKLLWRCSFWNQEYIKRFSLLWWLGWKSWVWRESRYEMSCGSIKLKVVEKVGRKAVHSFAALEVNQRIGSCTLQNPEFKVRMWKKGYNGVRLLSTRLNVFICQHFVYCLFMEISVYWIE